MVSWYTVTVRQVFQTTMSYSYDQNAVKERIREATDIVELVGHYIPIIGFLGSRDVGAHIESEKVT